MEDLLKSRSCLTSFYYSETSPNTDMCHLRGIHSEKCITGWLCCHANVIVHLHKPWWQSLNAYSIQSLMILGYKPVQHDTLLNTIRNSNTRVLWYYIIS